MKKKRTTLSTLLLAFATLVMGANNLTGNDNRIEFTTHPETGGITHIGISDDTTGMNWIVSPDNKQYAWIGPEYTWGLGSVRINNGAPKQWNKAESVNEGTVTYRIGNQVELHVERTTVKGSLVEAYTFKNLTEKPLSLSEMEINTPFNDNYPDAETCIPRRCHSHIWTGGNAAYVYAIRMGAKAPHLGLMLTEGSINGYVIKERAREKGMSNTRGIICLCPDDYTLAPGEEYTIRWTLFSHEGEADFYQKMKEQGGIVASADKYVGEADDAITLRIEATDKKAQKELKKAIFYIGDSPLETTYKRGVLTATYTVERTGSIPVTCRYGKGKETRIELWGVSHTKELINRRTDFIINRQQYHREGDPRDGALLPYDNETETLYLNWEARHRRSDLSEGRERVGMGIMLAMQCQRHPKQEWMEALTKYAHFVRTALQDPDYRTWSELDRTKKHRIYNYPWITHFYLETFLATSNKQYLTDAYMTQMAAYHYGGYNFYTIDVPVRQSITLLRENGMNTEAETLLGEYRKAADTYIRNGVNYPKFEVNYEQSIVAPSVNFICEMYLVTKEQRYLDAARELMPVVEAFGGKQPSHHLHDIALRHWDGYWFGKRQLWGDTMPHYWSCITADCFAHYSLCTGDDSYMQRAQTILRGNLCLFTEDGRGGCAWLYPTRVNNQQAACLEPMANDQDWALAYYLKWNK